MDSAINATSVSPIRNDIGLAGFTLFSFSLCPSIVDVGTTTGKEIEFFRSVLTSLLVPSLRVGSDSDSTGSRAGSACSTVSERVS